MTRFARTNAINLACEAGSPLCLTQTSIKLEQVLNGMEIAADLQPAIFCQGLRQGNVTHFSFLHSRMRNSNNQAERTLLQLALGCSQNSASLVGYIQTAFTDELRLSEKLRVLVASQNNGELGLRVMMHVIRINHDDIINVGAGQVNTMLSSIANRVSSEMLFNEFDTLLRELQDLNRIAEATALNFRILARTNIVWQQRNLGEIREWLQANAAGKTPTMSTN